MVGTSEIVAAVDRYLVCFAKYLKPGGRLIVATFSDEGPYKCSGIDVHRYSEAEMTARLQKLCDRFRCFKVEHVTPFDTVQNFLFCTFRRMAV